MAAFQNKLVHYFPSVSSRVPAPCCARHWLVYSISDTLRYGPDSLVSTGCSSFSPHVLATIFAPRSRHASSFGCSCSIASGSRYRIIIVASDRSKSRRSPCSICQKHKGIVKTFTSQNLRKQSEQTKQNGCQLTRTVSCSPFLSTFLRNFAIKSSSISTPGSNTTISTYLHNFDDDQSVLPQLLAPYFSVASIQILPSPHPRSNTTCFAQNHIHTPYAIIFMQPRSRIARSTPQGHVTSAGVGLASSSTSRMTSFSDWQGGARESPSIHLKGMASSLPLSSESLICYCNCPVPPADTSSNSSTRPFSTRKRAVMHYTCALYAIAKNLPAIYLYFSAKRRRISRGLKLVAAESSANTSTGGDHCPGRLERLRTHFLREKGRNTTENA